MSTPFFRFRQFTVWHDRCAMKVGTDAVLLGAWTRLPEPSPSPLSVLDIGTGSGVIALMLAQRLSGQAPYRIGAIDIDAAAQAQAADNFAASPWSSSLFSAAASLQDWCPSHQSSYHLIVSNPPYFVNALKNPDSARQTARHTDTLSYPLLVSSAASMLLPQGYLALVLPAEAKAEILLLAAQSGLALAACTHVYSKPSKPLKRVLLLLQKTPQTLVCSVNDFYIESDSSPRSEEYAALTREFYL